MTASLLDFGSYPWICENVARAACTVISRLLAGGAFPHCASVASWCNWTCWTTWQSHEGVGRKICGFLAHKLLYGTFVVCCFALVFTLPYQSLRWYNVIISSCIFTCLWTDQLTPTLLVFPLCLFVFVVFVFCLVFLFVVGFWCLLFFVLHSDSSMIMYRNSVLFISHYHYDWCCRCINGKIGTSLKVLYWGCVKTLRTSPAASKVHQK